VLSALVTLQGVALVAAAVTTLADTAPEQGRAGDSGNAVIALFIAGTALIGAFGLLVAARGLFRQRRWARAPVLVVQLILALVAVGPGGLLNAGLWYVAAPLLFCAVVVTVLLFAPQTAPAGDE
jgi:hypothetical protein